MTVKFKAEETADLEFEFPKTLLWEELDIQGVTLPENMKFVDIVIERETDILLVEIKDPSNIRSPEKEQNKYSKRLINNSVLKKELTPKARDSYSYMHLMERDTKPFKYIVLLGLDAYDDSVQKLILTGFKDRLMADIQSEGQGWKRKYVQDCVVLTVEHWNKVFDWPLKRISATA
ncbi:hypothetical protein JG479_17795 [Pseudoalteromonas sp. LC2018020214]|uniref:hypothetical protein n=1 Tax=Pseudoalteromonas sp. LC2018020214 TaxID=2799564 RepID=UPI001907112B|nr:hypothetical protein [Pseudoalteromonas sp. LC2018020214]QQM66441.1 hypothetical protein JG479_17795 [Pseudoalteromonas sp. LC2018020214]